MTPYFRYAMKDNFDPKIPIFASAMLAHALFVLLMTIFYWIMKALIR